MVRRSRPRRRSDKFSAVELPCTRRCLQRHENGSLCDETRELERGKPRKRNKESDNEIVTRRVILPSSARQVRRS